MSGKASRDKGKRVRDHGPLVGRRFGRLVVTGQVESRRSKTYWQCRCDCGGDTAVSRSNLTTGHIQSCGCMGRPLAFEGAMVPLRIVEKISRQADGCWIWTGSMHNGYGRVGWKGRQSYGAHRAIYELFRGEIPRGLQLDHLCRIPACVNPAHLEPVTGAENTRRSTLGERQKARTHCPKGHAYNEQNTYIDHRGHRGCKTCIRAAGEVYRKANRDVINARRRAK